MPLSGFNPLSLESVWRAPETWETCPTWQFQSAFAGECLERNTGLVQAVLEGSVSIRFRWRVFGEEMGDLLDGKEIGFNPLSLESVWRVTLVESVAGKMLSFNPLSLESVWRDFQVGND